MSEALNLTAYYYQFDATGCEAVDRILAAVARAGHSFHHTDDWNEPDSNGRTPVENIQHAANEAASEYERLRTLVAREWQDIATAPKDGTAIIGTNDSGEVFRCEWQSASYSSWLETGDAGNENDYCDIWWNIDSDMDAFPTHWMPLPTPPAPRTSGETG